MVEDTPITLPDIEERFGSDAATIVDGVTKKVKKGIGRVKGVLSVERRETFDEADLVER